VIELETSLHQFNPDHFGGLNDFLSTADSKERDTLMLACADHGTAPDNVSFAGTDRFFILQHLAACVPRPEDHEIDNSFGAIELGFENYNLRHAVVCGHLGCGVIPNWLKDTDTRDTGGLRARFRSTTVKAVDEAYPELTGQNYIERLICEHTLFQLENLQAHPFIHEKLDANELKLHLWVVNDQTARVLTYSPQLGNLVSIEEMP
jgi:carbonic anhydrase